MRIVRSLDETTWRSFVSEHPLGNIFHTPELHLPAEPRPFFRVDPGVPAERVIVVRNGPRTWEFAATEPDPALKRGFTHTVCCTGVMGLEDGLFQQQALFRAYSIALAGRRR